MASTEAERHVKATMEGIQERIAALEKKLSAASQLSRPVSQQNPFVISFVGKFKTGKSSLINALLGCELLPTKATTATSVVTRIFSGKTTQALVRESGMERDVTIEEAKAIILGYQVKDTEHPAEVIFECPIPWMNDRIEIRDTPGMDDSSQDGTLEKIALNALKDSDFCVCVFDASSMISGKERDRTKAIYEQMGGNVVFTVNCTNRLNSMERMNEVEHLSNTFFGEMKKGASGIGKHYLVCSAPGMIDLDGFDVWLKGLIADATWISAIRKASADSQLLAQRRLMSEEATAMKSDLNADRSKIKEQHLRMLTQIVNDMEKAGKEKAKHITSIKFTAEDALTDMDGLEEKLKACTTGTDWKSNYAERSAAVVEEFFTDHYQTVCEQWRDVYRKSDVSIIACAFRSISFPEPHSRVVTATTGEKVGGAGTGALIGSLFGPVGALIGGFIGGAIGASSSSADDSAAHTMSFVKDMVVPAVKGSFQTLTNHLRDKAINDAGSKAKKCVTGLETLLNQITALDEQLNRLIL
ncbi:MAG: dynamin family protein [Clostridia bacterium]